MCLSCVRAGSQSVGRSVCLRVWMGHCPPQRKPEQLCPLARAPLPASSSVRTSRSTLPSSRGNFHFVDLGRRGETHVRWTILTISRRLVVHSLRHPHLERPALPGTEASCPRAVLAAPAPAPGTCLLWAFPRKGITTCDLGSVAFSQRRISRSLWLVNSVFSAGSPGEAGATEEARLAAPPWDARPPAGPSQGSRSIQSRRGRLRVRVRTEL